MRARRAIGAAPIVRWPDIVLGAVAVATAVVTFGAMTLWRFVDGDEGDYAAAAGLVVNGDVLYRDFLYTQTPLLPYVYGAWGTLTDETWLGLRALSLVFAVALAVLVYVHLRRRVGAWWAALGVSMVAVSTLAFTWYPTVKTYALSTLLVFGAYVLTEWRTRLRARDAMFAGVLAGLSVQTRLLLVGGALVLGWAAWRRGAVRAFVGGFALGSIPAVVLLAVAQESFLFGNLWYHGARSEGGLVGDFQQKVGIVANLLGIPTDARPVPQYAVLIASLALAFALLPRSRRRVPLALATAAGLAVVALLPTPTYSQYFVTTVPFVVVGLVEVVEPLFSVRPTRVAGAAGALALSAYVAIAPVELRRVTTTFTEIRPAGVQRVADEVAARAEPGREVVASWPGYLYGTGARPLRGLENAFAPHEAAAIPETDAVRFHVASAADVEAAIRRRRTELVVVRIWHELEPLPDFDGAARAAGYRLVDEIHGARIYDAP